MNIFLSNDAYIELKKLLELHKQDYSCIKLSCYKKCCKNFGVDIILDKLPNNTKYFCEKFKDIPFIYDENANTNIKSIEIIYENYSFMIKTTSNNSCKKENGCNCNCKNNCKN